MLTALEKAKHAGARIVTVNPLPEAGLQRFKNPQTAARRSPDAAPTSPTCSSRSASAATSPSSRHPQPRCSSARRRHRARVLDHDFIAEHTHGFEAFAAHHGADDVAGDDAALADAVERTGLPAPRSTAPSTMVLARRQASSCAGRWA